MSDKIKSKSVVVTGATSGIGYQAALDFAGTGMVVIGVGRDPRLCREAQAAILQQHPSAQVSFLVSDLALQANIHQLAQEITQTLVLDGRSYLDILVNNAGLVSDHKVMTADGVELTFAVNHLAPFLLTHLLLPLMNTPTARVLTVSSNSHYHTRFNPLRAWNPPVYFILRAYKVSKLANVLFSVDFNRRNPRTFPRAYAIDPGLVNTPIGKKGTGKLVSYAWSTRQKKGTSTELPSQTILHVALHPEVIQTQSVYWRDSQPKAPSRAALDERLADSLWEVSCRLCKIANYFELANV